MRKLGTRVSVYPELADLLGLFHVSSHLDMEGRGDEVLFGFTRSVPEFISFLGVLSSRAGLSNIRIHTPQVCIGKREIGIKFRSMLEKRNRCGRTCGAENLTT